MNKTVLSLACGGAALAAVFGSDAIAGPGPEQPQYKPPTPVLIQPTTLVCKGGATRVAVQVGSPKVVATLSFSYDLAFDAKGANVSNYAMTFLQATVPAKADGSGLRNGECGYADRAMTRAADTWGRLSDENVTGTPVQLTVNFGPTTHVLIGDAPGGGVYTAQSVVTPSLLIWGNEASTDGKVFTVPLRPATGNAFAVASGQKPTMR